MCNFTLNYLFNSHSTVCVYLRVCVCVCVCMRACLRACMCVCVGVGICMLYAYACLCVIPYTLATINLRITWFRVGVHHSVVGLIYLM